MLYKEVFGLDISDASIEAIQLKAGWKSASLLSFGRIEMESGIVEDGKILQKEKLILAIREALSKALPKPITAPYVVVSIPESRVFTHIFKMPVTLDKEQAKSALKYEAEGIIPMAPQDIYWDFKVISKGKEQQEAFYVACPKKIINDFVEVLGKAGLYPLVFETESLAIVRSLVNQELLEKKEGLLVADIGARTSIISIFDNNGIRSSVNVPVAGNEFTKIIADKLKIGPKEAEEMKRKCGLDESKDEGRVMLLLQSVLQPILNEIKTSIRYYEKKTGRKISRILLAGGSSLMPKIDSYLTENLGLPTSVGKPWLDVKMGSKQVPPILLANALGLALRGVEKDLAETDVNLLPVEAPELIRNIKSGKISELLSKFYLKFIRKFQIFNFKEWAVTLKKYRLYLIPFASVAALFALVYVFKPYLAKIDYQKIFGPALDFLGKAARPAGSFFGRIFLAIGRFFSGAISSIDSALPKIIESVDNLLLKALEAIGNFFLKLVEAMDRAFSAMFGLVALLFGKAFGFVSAGLQKAFHSVGAEFQKVFQSVGAGLQKAFQSLFSFFQKSFRSAGEGLGRFAGLFDGWLETPKDWLLRALAFAKRYLWLFFSKAFVSLANWIKFISSR